jgi:hypothetical protein
MDMAGESIKYEVGIMKERIQGCGMKYEKNSCRCEEGALPDEAISI